MKWKYVIVSRMFMWVHLNKDEVWFCFDFVSLFFCPHHQPQQRHQHFIFIIVLFVLNQNFLFFILCKKWCSLKTVTFSTKIHFFFIFPNEIWFCGIFLLNLMVLILTKTIDHIIYPRIFCYDLGRIVQRRSWFRLRAVYEFFWNILNGVILLYVSTTFVFLLFLGDWQFLTICSSLWMIFTLVSKHSLIFKILLQQTKNVVTRGVEVDSEADSTLSDQLVV
jgi:hypothetical protein